MNITTAINLAKEMLSQHPELVENKWSVTVNRRKRAFGLCSYTKKEISLSTYLVPVMTDKAIKDTIIHEIAHALTKGHNHDRVWQRKCLELGGNGQRCGNYNKYIEGKEGRKDILSQVSKYTLTCPVCGFTTYMGRNPKRSYGCSEHGGYYDPKYKLVVTQNY